MKFVIKIVMLVFFIGCSSHTLSEQQCYVDIDKELRIKLFQECLKLVPAPPQHTTFADWDEMIYACNNVSKWQASATKCVISNKSKSVDRRGR